MKKWRPLDVEEIMKDARAETTYIPSPTTIVARTMIRSLNERMAELFPGEDEPKPEPATEDPPDYSCPRCKKLSLSTPGVEVYTNYCRCNRAELYAAANRRIAQLTRERDEVRGGSLTLRHALSEAIRQRDSARAQAIQDTKDAAEQMFLRDWYVGHAHSIRNLEVK